VLVAAGSRTRSDKSDLERPHGTSVVAAASAGVRDFTRPLRGDG